MSNVLVDTFRDITDHSVVTATTSFSLAKEVFLLESGRRFRKLEMNKAPWPHLQSRLGQMEWGPLEAMAKEDVTAAHALFINTIIEELVPLKVVGKRFGKSRKHKHRVVFVEKVEKDKEEISFHPVRS